MERSFGRGPTTQSLGDFLSMIINHVTSPGMILQEGFLQCFSPTFFWRKDFSIFFWSPHFIARKGRQNVKRLRWKYIKRSSECYGKPWTRWCVHSHGQVHQVFREMTFQSQEDQKRNKTVIIGKMVVPFGMVPLIVNPIYTFHTGYLLGISSFKGLFWVVKQLGYHPKGYHLFPYDMTQIVR